ncbi:MAG: hypothetical protein WCF90_08600 [Methanomicrobiales archaeon]
MPLPHLGKILLRWCDHCHAPVLAKKVQLRGRDAKYSANPPGRSPPAFPANIALINRIYTEHFSAPLIPEDHIALLNKVPDLDRIEEIIVGIIRYFPVKRRWEPVIRPEVCLMFIQKNNSSFSMVVQLR